MSKRKIPQKLCVSGVFLYLENKITHRFSMKNLMKDFLDR